MTPLEIESKRFTENVGEVHHEIKTGLLIEGPNYDYHEKECSCGASWKFIPKPLSNGVDRIKVEKHLNPTYTIELIRSELERVGKWEQFKFPDDMEILEGDITEKWGEELEQYETSDILTTPLLFLKAANYHIEKYNNKEG